MGKAILKFLYLLFNPEISCENMLKSFAGFLTFYISDKNKRNKKKA